ncbi:Coenzyme Q (ubiquinone) biosynthesis protein Coq4 [compost metagenome]
MRKLAKQLANLGDIILLLLRFSRLIINPKDISPIFKARTFRNHKSNQLALASLRATPSAAALMTERYLNPAPIDPEALMAYPPGTLGHEFGAYMTRHKLDVVFYPPLEDKDDDDISYVRMRARQTHDIHHLVLGFPPEGAGEMAISAFYVAQNRIPLNSLLIGIGFLYTTIREPERLGDLMECVIQGWTMGKQADCFLGVKWEEYWAMPLDEVRTMLRVPAQPDPLPLSVHEYAI